MNGFIFGSYCIVLKRVMRRKENQILNIKVANINTLIESISSQSIRDNWTTITDELDRIGISFESEQLERIKKGNCDDIKIIFTRIERYSKILAGSQFLEFKEVLEKDFDPDPTVYNEEEDDIEDVNIDDILSVRSDLKSVKEIKKMGKELPPGL